MADAPQKVLLFISHQPDSLKVATSFLKKRNFAVHVESDVKEAIVQVFDLKPDFIFVSWEHTDKKAQMLPKILAQSTASIVVPFINRNTKEAIFRFEQCPFSPKLYPPLSGPSVERLVMKSTMEDADYLEKVKKFKDDESKALVAQIQKNLAETIVPEIPAAEPLPFNPEEMNEISDGDIGGTVSPSALMSEQDIQNDLENRNSLLDQDKQPLTDHQKAQLQKELNNQVKPSLENVLSAQEVAGAKKKNRSSALGSGNMMVFKDEKTASQRKTAIYISKGTPKIQKPAKSDFSEEITKAPELEAAPPESENFYVHCISIICPAWCGYFIISCKTELDFETIELVFADWIKAQMRNLEEISERDYFNFDEVPPEAISEIQKMADYSEVMQAHEQDFTISFFAVEPKDMKIEFSNDRKYIEVFTRDIPPAATLGFDLLLHLPENQKYLLFTMKEMALTEDQRDRLLNRNVTKLFTKLENEYEYRRFLVMKTFSRLYQSINDRLAGT